MKDENTVLLFDWFDKTSKESIATGTKIFDQSGKNKHGTIEGSNIKYEMDGSIYFGDGDKLTVLSYLNVFLFFKNSYI